jgi:hypothetical protein
MFMAKVYGDQPFGGRADNYRTNSSRQIGKALVADSLVELLGHLTTLYVSEGSWEQVGVFLKGGRGATDG